MEIIWIIVGIGLVNMVFLIAIAGSLAKLLKYMQDESTVPVGGSREEVQQGLVDLQQGPLYKMENGEFVQIGGPTYDQNVFSGQQDPFADGLTNRPSSKNWDGIPLEKED